MTSEGTLRNPPLSFRPPPKNSRQTTALLKVWHESVPQAWVWGSPSGKSERKYKEGWTGGMVGGVGKLWLGKGGRGNEWTNEYEGLRKGLGKWEVSILIILFPPQPIFPSQFFSCYLLWFGHIFWGWENLCLTLGVRRRMCVVIILGYFNCADLSSCILEKKRKVHTECTEVFRWRLTFSITPSPHSLLLPLHLQHGSASTGIWRCYFNKKTLPSLPFFISVFQ